MLYARTHHAAQLFDEPFLTLLLLVVVEEQAQQVVQRDLLALEELDLEGHPGPVDRWGSRCAAVLLASC